MSYSLLPIGNQYACKECGAVVDANWLEFHEEWHEDLRHEIAQAFGGPNNR